MPDVDQLRGVEASPSFPIKTKGSVSASSMRFVLFVGEEESPCNIVIGATISDDASRPGQSMYGSLKGARQRKGDAGDS